MEPDVMGPRGTFQAMSTEQCWEFASGERVGRVGFLVGSAPRIIPVNHEVHSAGIYFRTSAYSEIAQSVDGACVAFEVDHIYESDWSGWSVLMSGSGHRVDESETLERLWGPEHTHPWASGIRNVWIEIDVREISGRMVRS